MKKVLDDRVEYRNSNGEYHRTDGPAVMSANGGKWWFINGNRLADMYEGEVTIFTKVIPTAIKQSIAMELLKV